MEFTALICNVVISILIPLIIWIILVLKNKKEMKGIIVLFLLEVIFYTGAQWGLKQHGLTYLFNHTDFISFMNNHYLQYLFIVALAGSVLAVIPEIITILIFGRKITFKQAISMGIGYTAAESTFLMGYQALMTIVTLLKDKDAKLSLTTGELFLSVYERIIVMVIGTGLIVTLTYFAEQKMLVRGAIIKVLSQTLILFLPGFFIAFSTKDYLEVFDRSVTTVMVYVLLTTAAVCALAIMNSVKWKMYEK